MELWVRVIDGVVIHVIETDPQDYYPPEYEWIHIEDDQQGIKYGWSGALAGEHWTFSPPPPEVVAPPIYAERDWRVSVVAPIMLQLQCLVATGKAAPEDVARLSSLRDYVVDLARLGQQPNFPYQYEWPVSPE